MLAQVLSHAWTESDQALMHDPAFVTAFYALAGDWLPARFKTYIPTIKNYSFIVRNLYNTNTRVY